MNRGRNVNRPGHNSRPAAGQCGILARFWPEKALTAALRGAGPASPPDRGQIFSALRAPFLDSARPPGYNKGMILSRFIRQEEAI